MTAAGLLARRSALPVVGVVGLVVAAALIVLGATGRGGFAANPVAVAALVAAAVIAGDCGRRLTADGSVRAGRWTTALGASLVVYLASALVAVATTDAVAIAVWNTMWLAPLALAQLSASAAVRRERTRVREHGLVLGTTIAAAVATLLLVAPTDPFEGVQQISPESWLVTLAPIGDVVTTVGLLALLVLPVRLGRAALTSGGTARAQLGVAAAGTAGAPLTVVFCLLLAVARDPGAVDPSTGSVGFLVALAGCTAVAAVCALLASRTVAPGSLLVVVRVVALAVAGLVVAGVGTLLTAPATGLGPTVAALAVAGLAVVVVLGGWRGATLLAAALLPTALLAATPTPTEADEPAPAEPRRVPGLTARENEVLALLAAGASNAGIAAQLVVSERTVDAHLRSVFGKLDLRREPDVNRRVLAARLWHDHPV